MERRGTLRRKDRKLLGRNGNCGRCEIEVRFIQNYILKEEEIDEIKK